MYKNLSEYKGVKVVRKKEKQNKPHVNGSYSKARQTITLYDRFFNLDLIIQESILEHEYSHHIWHKMPKLYQKIWALISNWRLINILNVMWITEYSKNAYVTDYAKTKITEDWAESIETLFILNNKKEYKGKSFRTFADFKMKTAKAMYDYFSKKELWK